MFEGSLQKDTDIGATREILPASLGTRVIASIHTDAGCIRESNEDFGRHIVSSDAETKARRGILTIVADGMGGHASGEVASRMAVELIGKYYYDDTESSVGAALQNAVERASAEIYQYSTTDENLFGMGTTVIVLVLLENIAYSAHVGDSRLYRLRQPNMELLTMDHSQVMELVKLGQIRFEEAWNHDDKNIILRALGTQPAVEVEVSEGFEVAIGDEFLLCSDGLSDMLPDDEIREIWSRSKNVHEACKNLIEQAKERGGHDNVTVGIVGISADDASPGERAVPATREMKGLEI